MKKCVFGQKVKTQQKNQTKTLREPGIEPGTSYYQSGCVTSAPASQLRESIVVKLFNCFDAMGRNVNKQSAGHTFLRSSFSVIVFHA